MKYVYMFSEGNKDMKNLLGGKGANLAEMTSIGLPVPRGFTITTEACTAYYDAGQKISQDIIDEIYEKLEELEKLTGKKMGDLKNPLLVSVRSGARASMPGMMDTVLNLGLNDEVCKNFVEETKNKRFVYDSYRRFIMMFADVVKGYSKSSFERVLDKFKEDKGAHFDTDLDENDMYEVAMKFKDIYKELSGVEFPQNPKEQLIEAVTAVFRSWNNERAIYYRRMNDIPSSWGTAVNVQEMVYGNKGDDCGTGVAFTRNPATGEKVLYGEYLMNAQGEDVVAGVRTPQPIATLKETMPSAYEEFVKTCNILETHYKDMQDMEFTIENGKLFMLQTRNGKRTGQAALKIAVDLYNEGMITKEEALLKVEPKALDQLLHPNFDADELKKATPIASGLAASPGAGCGKIYFTAEEVTEAAKRGEDTILVRLETSPEDIEGMNLARGVLTIRGGMTSHAAVVARGMGRCCVSGCGELTISEENKTLTTKDGKVFKEGDYISVDGSTTVEQREKALAKLLPMQRGDFEELYKEMKGNPVTIRFLDPPLHEFVPHTDEEIKPLAKELGMTFEALKEKIATLHEFNPMMGHRGCRLAVTYPEIAKMQTRAVMEAAINVDKTGLKVVPEIMIPLVGEKKELAYVKNIVVETINQVFEEQNYKLDYKIGTMIEIPRAAITADKIAEEAEFFSFGTNDLTQMTFGFSRDDAGKFLGDYYSKQIFESDPFARIDQEGVGELIKMAVEKGKKTRPDIKLGICGEHGGDPSSVDFCHRVGLSYVSCSPYRVPIARLAAAQAAINNKK